MQMCFVPKSFCPVYLRIRAQSFLMLLRSQHGQRWECEQLSSCIALLCDAPRIPVYLMATKGLNHWSFQSEQVHLQCVVSIDNHRETFGQYLLCLLSMNLFQITRRPWQACVRMGDVHGIFAQRSEALSPLMKWGHRTNTVLLINYHLL